MAENDLMPDINVEDLPKLKSGITWDKVFGNSGQVTPMGAAALAHHITFDDSSPDYIQGQKQMDLLTPKLPNSQDSFYDSNGPVLRRRENIASTPDQINSTVVGNQITPISQAPPNNLLPIDSHLQDKYKDLLVNPPQHSDFHESPFHHFTDVLEGKGIDNQQPYQDAMEDYKAKVGGLQTQFTQQATQQKTKAEADKDEAMAANYQNSANTNKYLLAHINHPGYDENRLSAEQQIDMLSKQLSDPSLPDEAKASIQGQIDLIKQNHQDFKTSGSMTPFKTWLSDPDKYKDWVKANEKAHAGSATQTYAMVRLMGEIANYYPQLGPMIPQIVKRAGLTPPEGVDFGQGIPGQPQNDAGEQIGLKMPEAPTTAVRTRGQMAGDVLNRIPDIETKLKAVESRLGPLEGRYTDIRASTGANDPEFLALKDNLETTASAFSRLHLNTEKGLAPFFEMLNPGKMTPDNIREGLKAIQDWSKEYKYSGSGKQPNLKPEDDESNLSIPNQDEKVFPSARVSEYAKQKGISTIKARKEIKDAGYTIK